MEERAKPDTPCAPLSYGGVLATRTNVHEKKQQNKRNVSMERSRETKKETKGSL